MKAPIQVWNRYLDYLIDASYQGVNKLFAILFEQNAHQTSYKGYFLWTVELSFPCYDVGKIFFDQAIKNEKMCQVKEMITQLVAY